MLQMNSLLEYLLRFSMCRESNLSSPLKLIELSISFQWNWNDFLPAKSVEYSALYFEIASRASSQRFLRLHENFWMFWVIYYFFYLEFRLWSLFWTTSSSLYPVYANHSNFAVWVKWFVSNYNTRRIHENSWVPRVNYFKNPVSGWENSRI